MNKNTNKQKKVRTNALIKKQVKKAVKTKVRKLRNNMRTLVPLAKRTRLAQRSRITRQTRNSTTISGTGMIYQAATGTLTGDVDVLAIIPANPCYWTGTKVAGTAALYQNYRPLKFKITYHPSCPTTTTGTIVMGTFRSDPPQSSVYYQSLQASNGGKITQPYTQCSTQISLKACLDKNLYSTYGSLDANTNPFTFIAAASGVDDIYKTTKSVGYFTITYKYELKNPLTSIPHYSNARGITAQTALATQNQNGCAYLITPYDHYPTGTILDIELSTNNQPVFMYHGSMITGLPVTALVWYFGCSQQYDQVQSILGNKRVIFARSKIPLPNPPPIEVVSIPATSGDIYPILSTEVPEYWTFLNPTGSVLAQTIQPAATIADHYFKLAPIQFSQDFGTYDTPLTAGLVPFKVDTDDVLIKVVTDMTLQELQTYYVTLAALPRAHDPPNAEFLDWVLEQIALKQLSKNEPQSSGFDSLINTMIARSLIKQGPSPLADALGLHTIVADDDDSSAQSESEQAPDPHGTQPQLPVGTAIQPTPSSYTTGILGQDIASCKPKSNSKTKQQPANRGSTTPGVESSRAPLFLNLPKH